MISRHPHLLLLTTLGTQASPTKSPNISREKIMSAHLTRIATLASSLLMASSLGLGCAESGALDDGSDMEAAAPEQRDDALVLAQQQPAAPNPNNQFIRDVTAVGSGCPAGTWQSSISADGLVFTTTFSAYELNLQPGAAQSEISRECQLNINFNVPQGISVGVTDFYFGGYAKLPFGSVAALSANYAWAGYPLATVIDERMAVVGPDDNTYLFRDKVFTPAWSSCGGTRPLLLNPRATVRSSSRQSGAYFNLSDIDADTRSPWSFGLTLGARPC